MYNNAKKDYIWNTIAGLINASQAVIMSMIVTRVTNLTDAGILTIAFALGNQMINIGKFGMRFFQTTDAKNQYSFGIYLKSRILTVTAMVVATCGYLFYAAHSLSYTNDKVLAILLICLIYAVEALEDVFWGYYQFYGHLDIGSQLFCVRWISILIVFSIVLIVCKSLVTALLLAFFVSVFVFCAMVHLTFSDISGGQRIYDVLRPTTGDFQCIKNLMSCCLPLFCNSFLSFYVNNSPKYAVDACMSDDVLACYGFVTMPACAIGLLSNFIYQPTVVSMAYEWKERKLDHLAWRIFKQFLIILGLTVVCLVGGYLLGIPLLSALYSTNLTSYKRVLMILLLASGILALTSYFGVVLTIMRCQKAMMTSYCIVAVIAFATMNKIVRLYGTVGAAVAYLLLMAMIFILYLILLILRFRKEMAMLANRRDENN